MLNTPLLSRTDVIEGLQLVVEILEDENLMYSAETVKEAIQFLEGTKETPVD